MIGIAAITRDEQVQAVARLVTSGWMLLLAGKRPASPDAKADPERVVATLPILAEAVSVEPEQVVLGPLDGRAEREGVIQWLRITTANGVPVLDGDVAVKPRGASAPKPVADLVLTRVDLLPRDLVEIGRFELFELVSVAK